MTALSAHRTCIILVNYNGYSDTIECVESLLQSDNQHFQVVIVDNASTNNSLTFIDEWAKKYIHKNRISEKFYVQCNRADLEDKSRKFSNYKIICVEAGDNLGFAGGNNIGLTYGLNHGYDYYWLLNNDTVVKPLTLDMLVKWQDKSKVGILGARLNFYHSPEIIQALGGRFNKFLAVSKHIAEGQSYSQIPVKGIYSNIDYVVGASMFVSRNFLVEVGLLSEDYFLYFEELDWAHRAKSKGWQIGTALEAEVLHKEGASAGSGHWSTRSSLSDLLIFRNRFLFISKFYPHYLPFTYLSSILIIVNRFRRGQTSIGKKMLKYVMALNILNLKRSITTNKHIL